jgi:hypothetical protein
LEWESKPFQGVGVCIEVALADESMRVKLIIELEGNSILTK